MVIPKIGHEVVDLFTIWYALFRIQIGELSLNYVLCGLFAAQELQKALIEAMFHSKCSYKTSIEILRFFQAK